MRKDTMTTRNYGYAVFTLILAALLIGLTLPQSDVAAAEGDNFIYEVTATDARLNRKVMGDVTNSVQGVPAEPVHSFVWDGDGSVPIEGRAQLEIDPVANTGRITAEWTDENGTWTLNQTLFAPPPHPSGLRVGSGASDNKLIEGDPVTTNVYLHGNTTAGEPVLPTLFNMLATWGPAKVTLNGEPFENPFDGPAPNWVAHTMTSEGIRNSDGQVLTVGGDAFNPMENPANGAVIRDDIQFHIVFHDVPGPEMTNNFPPPLDFFYHISFDDVKVEITTGDSAEAAAIGPEALPATGGIQTNGPQERFPQLAVVGGLGLVALGFSLRRLVDSR